jgi:hypothetical protein
MIPVRYVIMGKRKIGVECFENQNAMPEQVF